MSPLLSIVIANYNYGRYIESAIQSVLGQHCEDVELLVVDGGSSDQSMGIVRSYQDRIAWWCSEKDNGQSDAFNKGFAHAKGKYLTWVNADDVLVPGALRAIVRELKAHPDCEWFTGNFFRFAESDKSVIEIGWGPHVYPKWMQRKSSPLVVFGPSTIFSKSLWERVGRIDERLHFMMDMELWMRFAMAGVKQRRIRHFVWGFRMHEESKTAEFGEHQMDEAHARRFKAEAERVFAKTGYHESKFWRYAILALRLLDGSLLRRAYYKRGLRILEDFSRFSNVQVLGCGGNGYFRFQPWFCEALERRGITVRQDVKLRSKWRTAFGRLFGFSLGSREKKLIVCGCHRIEGCAWPWNYLYEIVPMMWDLWPGNYTAFKRFVRRNRVRTVLCTASQSVAWVRENCPDVDAVWIPEGIDVKIIPRGPKLCERSDDVICYGRRVPVVIDALAELTNNGYVCVTDGGATLEDLLEHVRKAKVSICYPLCDTNPAKAQGVETLTQRYWEAMLSGTLIVGRAPKELIDVCGYDPVIPLGKTPVDELKNVLVHIADYQELVDRNRAVAEMVASWDQRMDMVLDAVGKGDCR